ncbi:ephrin type-B receptor 2-like [Diadema antillarum]|uniref:ephrin type-B receptor 2-like n=2 Tax=Diadema antillarum TaxID=105358 RepID=UPI003A879315
MDNRNFFILSILFFWSSHAREVKLYDSSEYSSLDWVVHPMIREDTYDGGWVESGVSFQRRYQTCSVSSPGDNWLRMPYLERKGANRIHVEVKFTMYSCTGITDAQLCKETFDVYFYQSDEDDASDSSPNWTAPPYERVARIAAEGRFSDPDTPDENVINVRSENFGPVTSRGFYIAFRDQGACMALQQVRVFYQVCPQVVLNFAIFNQTNEGQETHTLVTVPGTCVRNAQPVPPDTVPQYICQSEGIWSLNQGGCGCSPGYEPREDGNSCKGEK